MPICAKCGAKISFLTTLCESCTSALEKSTFPSPTTHCFILSGGERQGPYLLEQLRSMWRNGGIKADATVEWLGMAEPLPIATLMRKYSFAPIPIWAPPLTIVGGICGLLASYVMRPHVLGFGPSIGVWLKEGFNSPYQSTIITCGVIGAVVGLILGIMLDKLAKPK